MLSLKVFGFYREHGTPNLPSIFDAPRQELPIEERERIYKYLDGAPFIVATLDLLDSAFVEGELATSSTKLTDGEWCWPQYFVHYFLKHNLAVPTEFLEKINNVNGVLPAKESLDFNELVDAMSAAYAEGRL